MVAALALERIEATTTKGKRAIFAELFAGQAGLTTAVQDICGHLVVTRDPHDEMGGDLSNDQEFLAMVEEPAESRRRKGKGKGRGKGKAKKSEAKTLRDRDRWRNWEWNRRGIRPARFSKALTMGKAASTRDRVMKTLEEKEVIPRESLSGVLI